MKLVYEFVDKDLEAKFKDVCDLNLRDYIKFKGIIFRDIYFDEVAFEGHLRQLHPEYSFMPFEKLLKDKGLEDIFNECLDYIKLFTNLSPWKLGLNKEESNAYYLLHYSRIGEQVNGSYLSGKYLAAVESKERKGDFFIHKVKGGYFISHIPTGMYVAERRFLKDAKVVLEAVSKVEGTDTDELPGSVLEELNKVLLQCK